MDQPPDRAPGSAPPAPPAPTANPVSGAPVTGSRDERGERGTLEMQLADRRPPEIPRAIQILRDIASALDTDHRDGIVHGDLAPARVRIGPAGSVTISDLGLPASVIYRAPEQWRSEAIGPRTDQYALGVVAFQMLTGQPPFEGSEPQDLMRLHLSAPVPRAAALRKGITPAMDAALRRAMAKTPELRFPTTSAFIDALSGDHPIRISLESIAAIQPAEIARGGGLPLAVGAALVAVLGLAVTVAKSHRTPESRLPHPSAAAPERAIPDTARAAPAAEETVARTPVAPPDSGVPAPAPDAAPVANGAPPDAETRALAPEMAPVEMAPVEMAPVPNGAPPEAAAADVPVPAAPRPRPSAGTGAFIRVTVRGGVAAVRIDGRTYGYSPAVVSIDPGTHVVTVDGAGDALLPSQRVVEAIERDTTSVVFTPRIQHDASVPDSNAAPLNPPR